MNHLGYNSKVNNIYISIYLFILFFIFFLQDMIVTRILKKIKDLQKLKEKKRITFDCWIENEYLSH